MRLIALLAVVAAVTAGCATKTFEELPPLDIAQLRAMSCEQLDGEILRLQAHERGVDEEASSGQAKQIFWGGLWSVMADEKLEAVARRRIRDRERAIYQEKLRKGCGSRAPEARKPEN